VGEPVRPRKGAAIIHVHGGWFNLGTARAYRNFVGTSLRALELMPSYPSIGSLRASLPCCG